MNLDRARAVADAVLYEGYLLYPYRASSGKNRVRWQFGVLGPPGVAEAGLGEEASMSMQCLLTERSVGGPAGAGTRPGPSLVVHLRFLQLQRRQVRDAQDRPVEQLSAAGTTWTSWDEAVEQEVTLHLSLSRLAHGSGSTLAIAGGERVEILVDRDGVEVGRVVRRRWPLSARVTATAVAGDGLTRLEVRVDNVWADPTTDKDEALRRSLLGAHLLVEGHGVEFVSLLDPPADARDAADGCTQHRCWPVLAGAPGDTDLVLGSPIILYDHPEIAAESAGALFDATEIDEILTLRVMTMTDQEKAEARATDPRAREIIDRCDDMSAADLQRLHGTLRDPHPPTSVGDPAGDVWWAAEPEAGVRPEVDAVVIDGVSVARDSLVRVHPSRRADAQDMFLAGQLARVTAVLTDVDDRVHVAVVLVDDPAADMHDWYGRYFYFAPDELEPLAVGAQAEQPEESRS